MSLIFILKSNNRINHTIIQKKISDIKFKNDSTIITYYLLKKKLLTNNNKNKKFFYDSIHFFSILKITHPVKIILHMLNIFKYNEYYITNHNIIENKLHLNNNLYECTKKTFHNEENINNCKIKIHNIKNTFFIKKIDKIRNAVYSKNTIDLNNLTIYFYKIII